MRINNTAIRLAIILISVLFVSLLSRCTPSVSNELSGNAQESNLQEEVECYLDLRMKIPETIICSDKSQLLLNNIDGTSEWNGKLSRIQLFDGWKIIAKYEIYENEIRNIAREGFFLLEGEGNYFLNHPQITIYKDKDLTEVIKESSFQEIHDKVQFMYIYPISSGKMVLSEHTNPHFGSEIYIGYDIDRQELVPNHFDTCLLDLRGDQMDFYKTSNCSDGQKLLIEPENNKNTKWNTKLTYIDVPDGWEVIVYYQTFIPPEYVDIDPVMEGYVNMSTGLNDLTKSSWDVYADFELKKIKRVTDDYEISYRVQKIYIQKYNEIPLVLGTSISDPNGEKLYIRPDN